MTINFSKYYNAHTRLAIVGAIAGAVGMGAYLSHTPQPRATFIVANDSTPACGNDSLDDRKFLVNCMKDVLNVVKGGNAHVRMVYPAHIESAIDKLAGYTELLEDNALTPDFFMKMAAPRLASLMKDMKAEGFVNSWGMDVTLSDMKHVLDTRMMGRRTVMTEARYVND